MPRVTLYKIVGGKDDEAIPLVNEQAMTGWTVHSWKRLDYEDDDDGPSVWYDFLMQKEMEVEL